MKTDYIILEKNKETKSDPGVIDVNRKEEIGISFNSEHMHRAGMSVASPLQVRITSEIF